MSLDDRLHQGQPDPDPAARPVDAALLDIGLPGLDGYELARRIRNRPGPAPFLIALTGYGRAADRTAAMAAGFDAHLTKPFNPDDLARVLATVPGSGGRGT